MPNYEYECNKCGKIITVLQNISAKKLTLHSECEKTRCKGEVVRLIGAGCGIIFRGAGWTPQFGSKTGKAMKKIDQALAKLGIEDESGGFSVAQDAPKDTKRKKKTKKVGDLVVD